MRLFPVQRFTNNATTRGVCFIIRARCITFLHFFFSRS